MRKQTCTVT